MICCHAWALRFTAEGWPIQPIASGEVTLSRVRDEKDWDYIGPVNGIVIYLHEDCDPVRLEFDRDLYIQEFIKNAVRWR
jgi:hypothetical protein